jgi:hypothetical protein
MYADPSTGSSVETRFGSHKPFVSNTIMGGGLQRIQNTIMGVGLQRTQQTAFCKILLHAFHVQLTRQYSWTDFLLNENPGTF